MSIKKKVMVSLLHRWHLISRYDIISLDERDGAREDMEGVDWAVNYLHSLVIQFPRAFCIKYSKPTI